MHIPGAVEISAVELVIVALPFRSTMFDKSLHVLLYHVYLTHSKVLYIGAATTAATAAACCCCGACAQVWCVRLNNSGISAAPAAAVDIQTLLQSVDNTVPCADIHQPLGMMNGMSHPPVKGAIRESSVEVAVCGRDGTVDVLKIPLQTRSPPASAVAAAAAPAGVIKSARSRVPANTAERMGVDLLTEPTTADAIDDGSKRMGAVLALCGVELPGQVFSSPVFVDDYVLIGCRDDHLYCFRWV